MKGDKNSLASTEGCEANHSYTITENTYYSQPRVVRVFRDGHYFHERPAWRSYYGFETEELSRHLKENTHINNTIKAPPLLYQGVVDIDVVGGAEMKINELQRVLSLLLSMGAALEEVVVFFSGSKGMHIHLAPYALQPCQGERVPARLKRLFKMLGVDFSVGFLSGNIREAFSPHQVSTQFKAPLPKIPSLERLMNAGSIENARELWEKMNNSPIWRSPATGIIELPSAEKVFSPGNHQLTFAPPPVFMPCMAQLLRETEAVRGEGVLTDRHARVLRLGAWIRRCGLPSSLAKKMLRGLSENDADTDRAVSDVYKKGYSFGCNDPYLEERCSPSCILYRGQKREMTAQEIMESLRAYAANVRAGRMISLQDILNFPAPINIVPGQVSVLMGDRGLNKSTLALHLAAASGLNVVYATLELSPEQVMMRVLQMSHDLSMDEVLERMNSLDVPAMMSRLTIVGNPQSAQSLIDYAVGLSADAVFIDTFAGLSQDGMSGSETMRQAQQVQTLTDGAHKHGLIVLLVHHINKTASREIRGEMRQARELTLSDSSGSSLIETLPNLVLGITGEPSSPLRNLVVLKNNFGPTGSEGAFEVNFKSLKVIVKPLRFDPNTLKYRSE
jgi:hypothetical protein